MNRNSIIAILGAAFAVSIGLMGLNGVFSMPSGAPATTYSGGEKSLGHLEVVDKDSSGNIKAYRQTDNVVTLVGRTCTSVLVFGTTAALQCNQGATSQTFSYIAIGSGSTAATTADSTLVNSLSSAQRSGYTVTNSTVTPTVGAIAAQSVVFSFVASNTVAESGIFDTTSGGHLYARQTIAPIGVNPGDTLTITWKITTG
jgi:hypothetical protein